MCSKSAPSWNVPASSIAMVFFCDILKTEHWVEPQIPLTLMRKLSKDLEPITQNFIHMSQDFTIALQY